MKEKKYAAVLLMILVSFSYTALALELPLINGDFELPGTVKIGDWDNLEDGDIPGWTSDERALESGVEMGYADPITGGDWSGFIYHTDPSVYNICDFGILPHRTYTLYVDAQDNWTSTPPAIFKMSLFYGTADNRIEIVSETMEVDSGWETYTLSFDPDDYPAAVNENIGVELENVTDEEVAEQSWIGIDNVKIIASDFVTLIGPEDGSIGQPIDSVLEWTVDTGWECNVYFGTDPNVRDNDEVITNETASSYVPDLDYATTYYWTVDAIDPNDGFPFPQPGPTWTFRTISDIPEIIEQPESVAAFLGETVQMTITVSSAFPPHNYQWYRDDVELSDNDKHTGTDSDTLTIHNIELTDEQASYYCEVSNSLDTVTSDIVLITLKRLLAHYKFENNLEDERGENDGLAVKGNIYYVDGIDGMAAKGDKSSYIELSKEAYPKAGVGNGLLEGSISCWIKISYIGGERRFFGAANSSSGTSIMLRSPVHENDFLGLLSFSLRDDSGIEVYLETPEPVFDNKWHHIVAAYDTKEGVFKLYDNGIVVVETTEMGMGDFSDWGYPVTILAYNDSGTIGNTNYTAPLDDLRIYNYAMNNIQIADLYYETTGLEICAVDYPAEYDLSGPLGEPDCVLDMYDMADLCVSWLECGLYPNCPKE